MIYKVTFHISTLYIYQISSTQELSTLQDMQERKKKTCHMISFYILKKLPTHKIESKYCIIGSINQDKQ